MSDDFPNLRAYMRAGKLADFEDDAEAAEKPRLTSIDHKAKAIRLLEATAERYPYDASKDVFSRTNGFPKDSRDLRTERREEALVHATLHLAEQTRLANLIQWAAVTNNHKAFAAEIEEGLRT